MHLETQLQSLSRDALLSLIEGQLFDHISKQPRIVKAVECLAVQESAKDMASSPRVSRLQEVFAPVRTGLTNYVLNTGTKWSRLGGKVWMSGSRLWRFSSACPATNVDKTLEPRRDFFGKLLKADALGRVTWPADLRRYIRHADLQLQNA